MLFRSANQGALPAWMTSPQENHKTLGLIYAIPLAYTVPGKSAACAYRLRAKNVTFSNIDFVVDRYALDNSLTKNFNLSTQKFTTSKETTFDRVVRTVKPQHNADYGLDDRAFDMINGQTVSYINAHGGLDGVTTYATGQTVVFLQQENYTNETQANDGWILNGNVVNGFTEYITSASIPSTTAGFPQNATQGQVATVGGVVYFFTNYDNDGILLAQGVWRTANLRAGIWQIQIVNQVVNLVFDQLVQLSENILVNFGRTNQQVLFKYDPNLTVGLSVPRYTKLRSFLSLPTQSTKFDNNGTKFLSARDTYLYPGYQNTWLKFPKTNIF